MGKRISSLSVGLFGDVSHFAKAFGTDATGAVQSFASKMMSMGTSIAAFVGGTAIAEGAISAFTGSIHAAVAGIEHSFESIDQAAKLSDSIGISTEALTGFQYAASLAGVSSEGLNGGLEFMLRNLGQAAISGGPAADAIQRLGLSVQQLTGESPDQAFKDIAQGIAQVNDPAMRARDAVDIFGKSGQQLLPLLMEGSQGIAAAAAEADKLGFSFSRVDARQVEQANDAITRVKSIATGLYNQLAVQLAPIIEEVATDIAAWATQGGGLKEKLGGTIKNIVFLIAGVGDTIMQVADFGFSNFAKVGNSAIASVASGLAKVALWASKIEEKTTGTHVFSRMATGLEEFSGTLKWSNAAGEEYLKTWRNKSFGDSATDFFDRVDNKAQKLANDLKNNKAPAPLAPDFTANIKKADDLIADLDAQVQHFGMTSGQIKIDELKHLSGVDPGKIGQAEHLQSMLEALETGKKVSDLLKDIHQQEAGVFATDLQKKVMDFAKIQGITPEQLQQLSDAESHLEAMQDYKKKIDDLMSAGKQTTEDVKNQAEKYQDTINKLNDELKVGAISWNTYQRAVAKAKQDLDDTRGPEQFTSIIKVGSAEAQMLAHAFPKLGSIVPSDAYSGVIQHPIVPPHGPAAVPTPVSSNSLPPGVGKSDSPAAGAWDKGNVSKAVDYLYKIWQNGNTPQLAVSSI